MLVYPVHLVIPTLLYLVDTLKVGNQRLRIWIVPIWKHSQMERVLTSVCARLYIYIGLFTQSSILLTCLIGQYKTQDTQIVISKWVNSTCGPAITIWANRDQIQWMNCQVRIAGLREQVFDACIRPVPDCGSIECRITHSTPPKTGIGFSK